MLTELYQLGQELDGLRDANPPDPSAPALARIFPRPGQTLTSADGAIRAFVDVHYQPDTGDGTAYYQVTPSGGVRHLPGCNRTSADFALLAADKVEYVLGGLDDTTPGANDRRTRRRKRFVERLRAFAGSDLLAGPEHALTRAALAQASDDLDGDVVRHHIAHPLRQLLQDTRPQGAQSDPVAEFVALRLVLPGREAAPRLVHTMPEAVTWWAEQERERVSSDVRRMCACCGQVRPAIRMLPMEVPLGGSRVPITSINKNAFASRAPNKDKAVLPLCWRCADTIARTLVAMRMPDLTSPEQHTSRLPGRASEAFGRTVAVYWVAGGGRPPSARPEAIDPIAAVLRGDTATADTPLAVTHRTKKLADLIAAPSRDRPSVPHSLDARSYHLMLLSPNQGRAVVRAYHHATIEAIQETLETYLTALTALDQLREKEGPTWEAPGLTTINRALQPYAASTGQSEERPALSPHETHQLLECALMGGPPPNHLLDQALVRLETAPTWKEPWKVSALLAIISLVLTHPRSARRIAAEVSTVTDPTSPSQQPAYLSGRLHALVSIVEQQYHLRSTSIEEERARGGSSFTSTAETLIGSAAQRPAYTLGELLTRTYGVYLPGLRNSQRAWVVPRATHRLQQVTEQLEDIPARLAAEKKALFMLGFFHEQRSWYQRDSAGDSQPDASDPPPAPGPTS